MNVDDYFKYIVPLNNELVELKEKFEAAMKALGLKEKKESDPEDYKKPNVTE